ncbi:hypothetical protein V5G65_14365 [Mammaliicoccus sciuri]
MPIWHKITYDEINQCNPVVVDKFSLATDCFTIDEIVDRISDLIEESDEV